MNAGGAGNNGFIRQGMTPYYMLYLEFLNKISFHYYLSPLIDEHVNLK